jgi:hypothetical protein
VEADSQLNVTPADTAEPLSVRPALARDQGNAVATVTGHIMTARSACPMSQELQSLSSRRTGTLMPLAKSVSDFGSVIIPQNASSPPRSKCSHIQSALEHVNHCAFTEQPAQ